MYSSTPSESVCCELVCCYNFQRLRILRFTNTCIFSFLCFLVLIFYLDLFLDVDLKVGDKLPSVELAEGTPNGKVNIADLFKGKKGVIFAVPGAFTPGCSKVKYLVNIIFLLQFNWVAKCIPKVLSLWTFCHWQRLYQTFGGKIGYAKKKMKFAFTSNKNWFCFQNVLKVGQKIMCWRPTVGTHIDSNFLGSDHWISSTKFARKSTSDREWEYTGNNNIQQYELTTIWSQHCIWFYRTDQLPNWLY